MQFAGFGHVCLVVSDFDACLSFYDSVMRHLGMRPYIDAAPIFYGWYADEYMFVIAHSAPKGDRFSQWRVGPHHLSFRARSRDEVDSFASMLASIGAKIVHPPEVGPFWPGYYSVLCEDPDGTRIEMNYIPREGWDAVAAASRTISK
jgi:catechol 2,3-dioxygenase-like lactoylglutathione lyase family enzyme